MARSSPGAATGPHGRMRERFWLRSRCTYVVRVVTSFIRESGEVHSARTEDGQDHRNNESLIDFLNFSSFTESVFFKPHCLTVELPLSCGGGFQAKEMAIWLNNMR